MRRYGKGQNEPESVRIRTCYILKLILRIIALLLTGFRIFFHPPKNNPYVYLYKVIIILSSRLWNVIENLFERFLLRSSYRKAVHDSVLDFYESLCSDSQKYSNAIGILSEYYN